MGGERTAMLQRFASVAAHIPELEPIRQAVVRRRLSAREVQLAREMLAAELLRCGLGEGDEVNEYGVEIETMIDWIGRQATSD